jgi:hypothetical protein
MAIRSVSSVRVGNPKGRRPGGDGTVGHARPTKASSHAVGIARKGAGTLRTSHVGGGQTAPPIGRRPGG